MLMLGVGTIMMVRVGGAVIDSVCSQVGVCSSSVITVIAAMIVTSSPASDLAISSSVE